MNRAWLLVLVPLILLSYDSQGADPPTSKPKSLMQKKLDYSQEILEGLTLEDFEQIAANAKAMNKLGLQEWAKSDMPGYKAQLLVFRFANGELVRLAEEKNIDGASLAYMQMTMSCIACHKYIRAQDK